MTQEEKQLLLKDLCARLPYGIMVHLVYDNDVSFEREMGIGSLHDIMFDNVVAAKPYLRPMSSMTEEEESKYNLIQGLLHWTVEDGMIQNYGDAIDWLNANHFDFRGLIEKGLALEAPANMYKTE